MKEFMKDRRDPEKCNSREEAFAIAYLHLHDKAKAFCVAYDADMRDHDIKRRASREYSKMRVQARILELERQREKNVQTLVAAEVAKREATHTEVLERAAFDVMAVMKHWLDITLADPTKVVTHRRICCRHCHGIKHAYQWRDAAEFADALAEAMDTNARRQKMKPPARQMPLPTDTGGYGFAFNAKPHEQCPRCLGEGESDVIFYDVAGLNERERKLIKGIKVGKYGPEVEFHDQAAAMVNIAKALGMLTEKVKIVDPDAVTELPALPLDPVEASRVYAQFVKGD